MSSIKRWIEGISYIPGYYRLFFLYIAIIILVFIYAVLQVQGYSTADIAWIFVRGAMLIGYSGIFFPIFIQNIVARLSRRLGWWTATLGALVGFYLILRFLVYLELLSTGWSDIPGLVYMVNFYGIVWTGMVALFGVINMVNNHGLSGLKRNLNRDVEEISKVREITRGEPLILDKRTVIILVLGLVFSGAILAFRFYYVKRPDRIIHYGYPIDIDLDGTNEFSMTLVNDVNRVVGSVTVSFSGYFRYPVYVNYTGDDILELAKSIPIIADAYEIAEDAPGDMVLTERGSDIAGDVREISLDFSDAFEYLGLYTNETAHLQIPSNFIVKWDRKDKQLRGVWVGTSGIPFMEFVNGTVFNGDDEVFSSEPYDELMESGQLVFSDMEPETEYGFNFTSEFHRWLTGEGFDDSDQFVIRGKVYVADDDRTRSLVEVNMGTQ